MAGQGGVAKMELGARRVRMLAPTRQEIDSVMEDLARSKRLLEREICGSW